MTQNGDGFADIVIGATNFGSSGGAAYVYLGGAAGISTTPTTLSGSGQSFGLAVSGAGDINADGFADVVVGGYSGSNAGQQVQGFYVFLGGASGLSASPILLFGPLGSALANAGDVNGDGFSDVIVGAPANVISSNGAASLYFGGAAGLAPTPTVLVRPSRQL